MELESLPPPYFNSNDIERRLSVRATKWTFILATSTLVGALSGGPGAQQRSGPSMGGFIQGVVKSAKGPEAAVWVIGETMEMRNKFAKIVVTDDEGRYVLPDLPNVNYRVWVRGYGLIDSKPVTGRPGQQLNPTAMLAPDGRAAAEIYPANYWLA